MSFILQQQESSKSNDFNEESTLLTVDFSLMNNEQIEELITGNRLLTHGLVDSDEEEEFVSLLFSIIK
jgi:hypothetical protein